LFQAVLPNSTRMVRFTESYWYAERDVGEENTDLSYLGEKDIYLVSRPKRMKMSIFYDIFKQAGKN